MALVQYLVVVKAIKERTSTMQMIEDQRGVITSLSKYVAASEQTESNKLLVPKRPEVCPQCLSMSCFWVHSYYQRLATEGELEVDITVPRYICRYCHLLISVLFAFLVPHRQFTVLVIAKAVETYVTKPTSYRKSAGELCNEQFRPHASQIHLWVGTFATKSRRMLRSKLQYFCVESGKGEQEIGKADKLVCRNAKKARSPKKFDSLNNSAVVLGLAALFFDMSTNIVQALQTYFSQFVQRPLSILTGRGIRLLTPQRLGHALV